MGQSIVLSRLKAEFLRGEEWIAYSMREWNELEVVPRLEGGESGLDTNARQWIHLEFETVQGYLDLARDAFQGYYVAYHTRAMLWLTLAVLVLATVQVGVVSYLGTWGWAIVKGIVQIVGGWLQ